MSTLSYKLESYMYLVKINDNIIIIIIIIIIIFSFLSIQKIIVNMITILLFYFALQIVS